MMIAIGNERIGDAQNDDCTNPKKFDHYNSDPIVPTTSSLVKASGIRLSSTTGRRNSMIRKMTHLRRFSTLLSTEDYNCVHSEEYFGPYAHLRKQLDYTYHTNYRKERQWLQDSIIEDMLEAEEDSGCIIPSEPWLIFTVGIQGAGKGHVIRKLTREGKLPLLSFVHVDPDQIRQRLPEYTCYAMKCPDMVDSLTRKECGYIGEILTLAALQTGRNVIVDGALQSSNWHKGRILALRKEYPCLKFGIFHIHAPLQLAMKRSQKKALDTGRAISADFVQSCLEDIPDSLEELKPCVDYFCEFLNSDKVRLVSGLSTEEKDDDWNTFQQRFFQTCAWMPGMKGKQKLLQRELSKARVLEWTISSRRRLFSVSISSEDNNRADHEHYYGKFSHIRKTLDYTYHANYTFERQKLQDAIISDMLDEVIIEDVDGKMGTVPTEPWIVFTAGAMGAGKSYAMRKLVENGRFPLTAFVIVDPDEIRHRLPEFHMYVEENPELAGSMTRKEAGFIAEILTLAALQAGKNVLQDGSLRDSDWYHIYFQRLRNDFPRLRQAILHVTAPREAVFQRAAERALTTHRIVPRETLEAALEQVPRSVKVLAPLVDYYAELDNSPGAPDIVLTKPEGSTWEMFKRQWLQTVAYVPHRKRFLEKIKQYNMQIKVESM